MTRVLTYIHLEQIFELLDLFHVARHLRDGRIALRGDQRGEVAHIGGGGAVTLHVPGADAGGQRGGWC